MLYRSFNVKSKPNIDYMLSLVNRDSLQVLDQCRDSGDYLFNNVCFKSSLKLFVIAQFYTHNKSEYRLSNVTFLKHFITHCSTFCIF